MQHNIEPSFYKQSQSFIKFKVKEEAFDDLLKYSFNILTSLISVKEKIIRYAQKAKMTSFRLLETTE